MAGVRGVTVALLRVAWQDASFMAVAVLRPTLGLAAELVGRQNYDRSPAAGDRIERRHSVLTGSQ